MFRLVIAITKDPGIVSQIPGLPPITFHVTEPGMADQKNEISSLVAQRNRKATLVCPQLSVIPQYLRQICTLYVVAEPDPHFNCDKLVPGKNCLLFRMDTGEVSVLELAPGLTPGSGNF